MNSNDLKYRIKIQKSSNSSTTTGKPLKTYSFLRYCYANVNVSSGNTQYNAQYESISTTVIFTIRYNSSVDYDCQIIWNEKTYKIEFIEPIEQNSFMKIITTLT